MLREIHFGAALRMTALCVAGGTLIAGCEPPPTEDENEQQLSRAQEATPLREDENPQGRQAASSQAPAERETDVDATGRSAASAPSSDQPMRARAELEPTQGNQASGTIEFETQDDGNVVVVAMIEGLEPGPHGFHIHESGDCSAPDASSAGEHFDPNDDPHGSPEDDPAYRHAGDLGSVNADDAGVAEARVVNEELELTGEHGVVGRAAIVHENRDDLESQPSGDSGDPVACGVIRMVDEGVTRQERSNG